PLIRVLTPATTGGITSLVTGAPVQAQGGQSRLNNLDLRDDLTFPIGASHEASVGVEAEWFRVTPGGVRNAFGTWTFSSLDSLEAGRADRYDLSRAFGSAGTPLSGHQYAGYLGDYWRVDRRFALTLGVRADRLAISERAPYNRTVDSLFARRT